MHSNSSCEFLLCPRVSDAKRSGLLWPFAAVPHQSYFVLAEIGIRDGLFISNDSQLLKEDRQLAGIENHGRADWSAFGRIAMESFNDENSTRLESALKDFRHLAASHVTDKDQVPPALSEVKGFHSLDLRL